MALNQNQKNEVVSLIVALSNPNGGGGGSAAWGSITGSISDQSDLQSALNAKAPLASPALTGTPTAPTAISGTSTTQIATTEFVQNAIFPTASLPNGEIFVGNVTNIPTPVPVTGVISMTNTGVTSFTSSGDLTETISNVLTITGGTGALLSSVEIEIKQGNNAQDGYISSTDWDTFNNKANLVPSPILSDILISDAIGQPIGSGYNFATAPISDAVNTALGNKADKVIGAINGNFASLNVSGNLVDSNIPSNILIKTANTTALYSTGINGINQLLFDYTPGSEYCKLEVANEEAIIVDPRTTIDQDPYVGIGDFQTISEIPSSKLDVLGNIEITDISAYYIGDPNTNGSWRWRISGTDLVYERRESGIWVIKQTIFA